MKRKREKSQINWQLTRKVREAVYEDRVIISDHFFQKMGEENISIDDLNFLLKTGVVLTKKQKDELKTAIDGYKHFLEGLTPSDRVAEVVFKFVKSIKIQKENLLILITIYKERL